MSMSKDEGMNRERPQGQGRRRINIEKIVDKSKQQVTFCKRRKGIFTKASELCTLCNAEVAILTFSSAGKIFSFGHPSADQVVNRYVHQTKSESESESSDDGELWWEKTIDECLGLEELKTYKSSLEELRDNVANKINELIKNKNYNNNTHNNNGCDLELRI